jgi:hypothetical protein
MVLVSAFPLKKKKILNRSKKKTVRSLGRIKKTAIFAVRKIRSVIIRKISNDEENISAIEQEKKKQAWIQGKNGYCKRQEKF